MNNPETSINAIVDRIVARHSTSGEAVIPILQDIQLEFNYLPEEALKRVCEITEITPSSITGISTFYSQFRHKKAGEHIIRVCTGTACHVKGALNVLDAFRRELKIEGPEDTDAAGKFTIEKVACLGCCTLAPVIKIDEVTYGHVSSQKVGEIISDFLSRYTPPQSLGSDTLQRVTVTGAPQRVTGSGKTQRVTGTDAPPHVATSEIRIGLGSCCVASGSAEVKAELDRTIAENNLDVNIKQVGCVGICNQVPVLEIVKPGEPTAFYARIRPDEVNEIVLRHFRPTGFLRRFKANFSGLFEKMIDEEKTQSFRRYDWEQRDTPISGFLGPQITIATENRGILKPCDLAGYESSGGFEAIKNCLSTLSPQQIIDCVRESGLRGRGGAGFPTGIKWQLVKDQSGPEKYLICNGDEGDPGAFMDRMLLESYPFRIIEGMLIAAFAISATKGLFYIRAEYPLAVKRIKEALAICRENGIVGKNIFGTSFSFDIDIFEGAGAFVCGEETALIASVEGKRGIPRLRPPYPAVSGLNQKPTLINNTETFSMISWILKHGAEAFAAKGTSGSKGTKVFALAGKINRGGLIEVPMGITIRQIVEEIGNGIQGGLGFKAVQIGGPSGGCIPASMADLAIDFEELNAAGSMMGSGGLIVLDEKDCMVDIARYFLSFTQNQSCGKCTFCRIGTTRMLEILEKIRSGEAGPDDLIKLEKLAISTKKGSLCGLGKTAPNPVLSTLRYFREEYEAHLNGTCPAGKCAPLITYSITDECIGCTKCAQQCPTEAITFKPYEVHTIDTGKCIKCDICRQVCPVNSVIIK